MHRGEKIAGCNVDKFRGFTGHVRICPNGRNILVQQYQESVIPHFLPPKRRFSFESPSVHHMFFRMQGIIVFFVYVLEFGDGDGQKKYACKFCSYSSAFKANVKGGKSDGKMQCFGSGLDPDSIRSVGPDPDPGEQK
jgi:hypothetical protein